MKFEGCEKHINVEIKLILSIALSLLVLMELFSFLIPSCLSQKFDV